MPAYNFFLIIWGIGRELRKGEKGIRKESFTFVDERLLKLLKCNAAEKEQEETSIPREQHKKSSWPGGTTAFAVAYCSFLIN